MTSSLLPPPLFSPLQYYDMGTGKNYSPSRGYPPPSPHSSRPSYTRTASYDGPKYRSTGTSVTDTLKRYGDTKYSPSGSHDRFPSVDRSLYPAPLDRYGSKSGYMSDYGAGSPYSSWDRVSTRSNATNSRYGAGSREGSPVSTRSSRYDNSSSASGPYSTYSSYKSAGSELSASPASGARGAGRPYERQSSRGYEAPASEYVSSSRRSSHSGGPGLSSAAGLPGARALHDPSTGGGGRRGRRGASVVSTGSEDSAPEAEERDTPTFRYLICRGTSPIREGEPREARVKDKSSVSRTRRLKVPDKGPAIRPERSTRKGGSDKGRVDCSIQTNLDQPQSRRQRTSSNTTFAPPGTNKPGETYYKYREKVLGSTPDSPRSYHKQAPTTQPPPATSRAGGRTREDSWRSYTTGGGEDGVNSPPNERSWRQSVYGEPEPPSPRRREGEPDSDTDDRSSRHGRRRRGDGPRTSTPSTMRDRDASDYGEERKSRRSKASRSSSREDMLDGERPRRKRHSSKEFLDEREPDSEGKPPLTPEALNVRDSIEKVQHWKQNLPPPEPMSPDGARHAKRHPGVGAESYEDQARGRSCRPYSHREESPPPQPRSSRQASRQGSRDSMLEDNEDRDPSLPNKDFRKSQLNRADHHHYYEDPEVFEREASPGDSRRRHRRGEGYEQRMPRQSSDDHKRLNRDNSRESMLSEARQEVSDSNGSQFGFNREESPNTRRAHTGRHSRHGSREDGLDERPYSRHSGAPPDPGESPPDTFQLQQPPAPKHHNSNPQHQYQGQRSGMIGQVDDIDSVLSLRHPPRSGATIMDEPVPPNCHYPLRPAPASPMSPPAQDDKTNGRPNSYAFEQYGNNSNNMRTSKSHGDKLIDIEDNAAMTQHQRAPPAPAASVQQQQHHHSRGSRSRQPSATAQQMWTILQSKKGLVTITDFVSLCEKSGPQRKLITVPGAEGGEQYFKGYNSADEMLESMGVDVRKVKL